MNSPCDRFETEALLRLERGEPLDEHFATCPDCREARAVYERLRQEIAEVDGEEEPPPGWEARVRERIEQRRRRPRWAWFLAPLGATALAAFATDWQHLTAARERYAGRLSSGVVRPDLVIPVDTTKAPITIRMKEYAQIHGLGACTPDSLQGEVVEGPRSYPRVP